MAVTENGRFLASAGNDKIIKVWDMSTGMEFRTIYGSDGRVEQLAFSPDNVHLAGTSFNEELLIYNVLSGDLVQKKTSGSGRGLSFTDNGNGLVYINESSQISYLNIQSGETRTIVEDHYASSFVVDIKKELIYSLDHLGSLLKIDLKAGTIIETYKLFDTFNYPFSNSDITQDGHFIAFGFNDDKLRIFDTEQGRFVFESDKYKTKIVSIAFDRKKPVVYLSGAGSVYLYDFKKKKLLEETQIHEFGFATQSIAAHPDGEIVLFANHNRITLYDFKRKKVFRKLEKRVDRIYNMAYDPTGRYLVVATDQIKLQVWDLKLNKVVHTIEQAFFPCTISPDGKTVIAMAGQIQLGAFDIETGEKLRDYDTGYEFIQTLSISPDGKYLAGAGFQNKIKLWELETGKKQGTLSGHTAGIQTLDFHPTKPWIASGGLDETTRVWDYEKKQELKQFNDQAINTKSVRFSPDGKQLATGSWDHTIHLRNTENWETTRILKGHVNVVNSIDYSADGRMLISGGGNNSVAEADNSIICWDVESGEQICQFKDHSAEILKVICDKEKKQVYSASVDGAIKLSDFGSCELIATYHAIGDKEFMIYTPDNYYIASRSALRGVAFRLDGKLVPFEQFDIHLNRPDIVAKRIGKSSERLINAYHYLYKKRLRKLNLDEGSLKLDFKLPKLINETKYDLVTTEGVQKLWVKAWDDDYNITQINIYVNDVPIFGEEGYRLSEPVKSYRGEFEVPLINGVNKILISCRNSNGVESLYENIEIIRNGEPEKHDLYLVAIGVSDYKDDRFNLKYPTKDAKDMINKFMESRELYKSIHTKSLLNEEVTIENIIGLGDFFSGCSHEDMAIIFIAGHGVLNVDYDYFFGTYDMDFDQPESRGLPYDKISGLLNKIRAYQKLLIMDTCHSGELDKEEIETGPEVELEEGDVEFRGVASGVRKKEGIGFENSLKITEDLFSDIRKGSGATVVSSAGGAEFAMESDEWNNGLFTYAFLHGLTNNAANTNKDQYIQLSEIREYVNQTVTKLSGGKQIPSAREENISRDYIIFGK